jgi:ribosomal protein L29
MSKIKFKDIKAMSQEDRDKRMKELKLELIRASANATKKEKTNKKEIKKLIARILTLNKQ